MPSPETRTMWDENQWPWQVEGIPSDPVVGQTFDLLYVTYGIRYRYRILALDDPKRGLLIGPVDTEAGGVLDTAQPSLIADYVAEMVPEEED